MIFNFFLFKWFKNFQKEINVIMYIIVIIKNSIISFKQKLNKIWISKCIVFWMFKMKGFDK
jgi:hypothetical protein